MYVLYLRKWHYKQTQKGNNPSFQNEFCMEPKKKEKKKRKSKRHSSHIWVYCITTSKYIVSFYIT